MDLIEKCRSPPIISNRWSNNNFKLELMGEVCTVESVYTSLTVDFRPAQNCGGSPAWLKRKKKHFGCALDQHIQEIITKLDFYSLTRKKMAFKSVESPPPPQRFSRAANMILRGMKIHS